MTQETILDQIHNCFAKSFEQSEKVLLKGGFSEPFYLAKNKQGFSEIQYRNNYPSSALHEIAHWCVAGREKRELNDFGYWYEPDGRNDEQQKLFFEVEAKPQAYECLLSLAFNLKFQFSIDNLSGHYEVPEQFKDNFTYTVENIINNGHPHRLGIFLNTIYSEIHQRDKFNLKEILLERWSSTKLELGLNKS